MKKNYLVLYESGDLQHVNELTGGIMQALEDGIVDLVDITDPNNPLETFVDEEGWSLIEHV